jgi:hypothetical protein
MALPRVLSRPRLVLGAALVVAAGVALPLAVASAPPVDPAALALPGPNQLVSGLDLECFPTQGPALNLGVQLSHLNPVLRAMGLPPHNVVIRELVETCVPVSKNGVVPQPAALPFIQHIDLACYRVEAAAIPPVNLTLKHLNPVLINLPSHVDVLLQPQQLCLPVGKNGVVPPPEVLRLVQFIDLECYRSEVSGHPAFSVVVKQLNPQLGHLPNHTLALQPTPRQLCVPVVKNNQQIPTDILNLVQWIDLERFPAQPVGFAPTNVVLNHFNPLFTTLPRVPVVLNQARALMVPVSKNGQAPPPP